MDRKSIVILILALTLFGKIGAADSSEKEGAGDDAGENVNAEAEAKTNTPKDEKEYNDSTKPEGDANSKKKELPDTINIVKNLLFNYMPRLNAGVLFLYKKNLPTVFFQRIFTTIFLPLL